MVCSVYSYERLVFLQFGHLMTLIFRLYHRLIGAGPRRSFAYVVNIPIGRYFRTGSEDSKNFIAAVSQHETIREINYPLIQSAIFDAQLLLLIQLSEMTNEFMRT